jgi:hypothetical protein
VEERTNALRELLEQHDAYPDTAYIGSDVSLLSKLGDIRTSQSDPSEMAHNYANHDSTDDNNEQDQDTTAAATTPAAAASPSSSAAAAGTSNNTFLVGLLLETLNDYANFATSSSTALSSVVPNAIQYCFAASLDRLAVEDSVRSRLAALQSTVEVAATACVAARATLHRALMTAGGTNGEGDASAVSAAATTLQVRNEVCAATQSTATATECNEYTPDASLVAAIKLCTTYQRVLLSKLRNAMALPNISAAETQSGAKQVAEYTETVCKAASRILVAVSTWHKRNTGANQDWRVAQYCLGPASPVSLLSDFLPGLLLVTLPPGAGNATDAAASITISKHAVLPSVGSLIRLGEAIQPYTAGGGLLSPVLSVGNTLNMLDFLHSSVLPLLIARSAALEATSIFDSISFGGNGEASSGAALQKYSSIFSGGVADDVTAADAVCSSNPAENESELPFWRHFLNVDGADGGGGGGGGGEPGKKVNDETPSSAIACECVDRFVEFATKKQWLGFVAIWKRGTFQPTIKLLLAALIKHLNANDEATDWMAKPADNDAGVTPPPALATIFSELAAAHQRLQQKSQAFAREDNETAMSEHLVEIAMRVHFVVNKFHPAMDLSAADTADKAAADTSTTTTTTTKDDTTAASATALEFRRPVRESSAMTWGAFADDSDALRKKSSWLETKLPMDKLVTADEKLAKNIIEFALNAEASAEPAILQLVKAANASSRRRRHGYEAYGARFFDRNLHSRMPLDPTHVRLKRTRV